MKKCTDYDFEDMEQLEEVEYETVTFMRRLLCYALDLLIIAVIWFLFSYVIFRFHKPLDDFMTTLGVNAGDFEDPVLYEELRNLILRLIVNLILTFIASQTIYFTLVPSIIGNGQTVGKLFGGISMVDIKTLEEIKPLRLIYREFVLRGLLETLLILPGIVSVIICFVRKDKRSLHDLLAKTVIIKTELR